MRRRSKYGVELNLVEKHLEEDPGVSITTAVKAACKSTGLVYHEKIRKAINKSLVARGKGKKEKEVPEEFKVAQQKTFDKRKKTFIITYAQNATPVHANLWKNIEAYSKSTNANLHVIAGRYKNPTSVWTDKQESDEWWAEEAKPFLDAGRHNIHKYLQVLSDVKMQPTASMPLSGMNGFTGLESCIVGHPRQHLKSLPVLEGYPHKLLLSTGACTVSNYSDSKAGKKGDFHHMLGFVIVELDGDKFHIRQVSADKDGNFYDVYKRVKDGIVQENKDGIDAAILGDIHIAHNCKEATDAAFEFIGKTKPKFIVAHDISEMESILHWDEKDPFRLLQKEELGLDNLQNELDDIMDWIEDHKHYGQFVIARSNHDDMLDRWLKATDWRKARNKKTYLELSNILATEEVAQKKGVLPYLIEQKFDDIITLSLDDSFRVHEWELAMHGHLGANGSRGGHTQFKNLNTKNAVGHGHHPHREDGHVMVGTLSHLRVGFNKGPSNWMNGFGVIYPDGQFQILHIINGKICR
tara:strand:+ start:1449 stop:3020 length:1572 start_codon:yes stop_codon:yes gene_type:complete